MEKKGNLIRHPAPLTSIEKALEVCEVLSGQPRGVSLSDLSRTLRHPPSTVHRLLSVLKRRGYVRQDEDTERYSLTLKMLDLSFRSLGRSELRLHAYPHLREYVLGTAYRGFIAIPASGEVTYLWRSGPDEVAMHTVYGREMPSHCALYFSPRQATRRLSCLKLATRDERRYRPPVYGQRQLQPARYAADWFGARHPDRFAGQRAGAGENQPQSHLDRAGTGRHQDADDLRGVSQ
jgi:hypothetical protein